MPVEDYIAIDVYSYYTSTEEFSIATTYKASMLQITYEFSIMLKEQS